MSSTRLRQADIHELHEAVVALDLDRNALMAGINPAYVLQLKNGATPGSQILIDLHAMNQTQALKDDSDPLRHWLCNAKQLAALRPECEIFDRHLASLDSETDDPRLSAPEKVGSVSKQRVSNRKRTILMTTQNISTITNSSIGAIAIGSGAQASGTVNLGPPQPTQEQYRAALKEAQSALVNDQDTLDQIDTRLYEAFGQFLRLIREIQVEQKNLADIQLQIKATLDEVWARTGAPELRGQMLPKPLGIAKAFAENPMLLEVAKMLFGS